MCQYSIQKEILVVSIVILSMICISGCEQTKNLNQNVQFDGKLQKPTEDVQSIWGAVIDEGNRSQAEVNEIQDMPEINGGPVGYLTVRIQNKEQYEGFISRMEEFIGCDALSMDLGGTDTPIYLDEILVYQNFERLYVRNGGNISFKDAQILNYPIHSIELSHAYAIEEDLLDYIISGNSHVQYGLTIELDNRYSGKLPIEELLNYGDCEDVILVWDDNTENEGFLDVQKGMENLKEWNYLQSIQETSGGCLKGIYSLNDEDYSYTSYEFYNHYEESVPEVCAAFICVKDRESNGEKYFDIIDIPENRIFSMDLRRGNGMRLHREDDVNFDGYNDLIFQGYNVNPWLYVDTLIYLWNDEKQIFEFCESAPKYIDSIDVERKRLTYSTALSASDEDYYIYEFKDNVFTEKHLKIRVEDILKKVTEEYFEDGKLIARIELVIEEGGSKHYYYEVIGSIKEEIQVESDLSFREVSKIYFPEFDFFIAG